MIQLFHVNLAVVFPALVARRALAYLIVFSISLSSSLGQTPVKVNRTVPNVAPPRTTLEFSSQPTTQEISRARAFEEPLVPIGGEPSADENAALAAALLGYAKRSGPDDFASLTVFLLKHPNSPWSEALLTDLGLEYYNTAHYSLALEAWAKSWSLAKEATDPGGKAIGDRAAGELAYLYARLGRITELEALLKSVDGRVFIGPATEKITGAREGLWNMQNRPEISFRCGPLALHQIKRSLTPQNPGDMEIFNSASTQKGFSLPQVAELSKKVSLDYQMAFREKGGAFVVPSVVHWKVGHYAALIRQEGDRYLLQDPTFRNDVWATRQALETETSGYFLIPQGPLGRGWRAVETKEGEAVWGKGNTSSNDRKPIGKCDPQSGGSSPCDDPCKSGNGGGPGAGSGGGGSGVPVPGSGMAVSSVHLMTVNLNLHDTPVGYAPPVGPPVHFEVRYNHRDAFQPTTFTYSNFGSKWTCDWISYITDNPQSLSADVDYYMRGGGTRTFISFSTNAQTYAYQQMDQTQLKRTGPTSYEMVWPNGSKQVFSQSDGSIGTSRKIFLTQVVDPSGNTATLTYDGSLRLVAITDAIGQVTTLTYGNVSDTYKITQVTDPFGRFASFNYDTLGRLTNITDVIGLSSRFSYETNSDFINSLITPYGTNTFGRGENGRTRWLETVYADGSRDRVEYNQTAIIPESDPTASVPTGMMTYNGGYLSYRNTYYWSRNACAQGYGDYTKAKIYHWLHGDDFSATSGILESTKEALEGRVWFDYPGQSSSIIVGSSSRPTHIGRVLDDGSTQLYTYAYDGFGHVTNSVDPLGRTFSYLYASNGIDLLETRMTRAGQNELLSRTTYNGQHLPLTVVDTAGQTNTYTYNARGQLLTKVNPKNETTSYTYDINNYLIAVDGPLPGTNDVSTATYDALGRIRTRTDVSGYTVVFDHDDLDRITRVSHPDSTFEQITYDRLDPAIIQDRAGRQTLLEYDTVRQLTKRTDPLNRATLFQWCSCGDIKSLTDPMGRTTSWRKDVQNRLVSKQYGDGSHVTYTYENTTSRLRQTVDEKLQSATYSYNRDDTVNSTSYANAAVPTPAVSFAYDPNYQRPISITDGTGTTRYNYVPITALPSLGAGQLASLNGPLADDTITYGYDELGRRVSTAINGVASLMTFDSSGRVVNETNSLGSFAYTYDGTSGRILSETFPNTLTIERSYADNLHDRDLQRITFKVGATPVSEFVYGRDIPAARITTWSQQIGAQPPSVFSFGYDPADQLLSGTVTNAGSLINTFAYNYDLAGNRLIEQTAAATNAAVYNALNQINNSVAAGVSRTNEWDAENRLVAVNAGPRRTEFSYDGMGRMTTIRQLTNGFEASFRRFVWCDSTICEERNASGTVTKRYFAQGMKVESGATAGNYYYTRDHLGSIRELTDSSGNVRARYAYDPFGRRTRLSGDVDADFGFTGIFWSAEAGLALTRYRAYDPELGRWLSRDPLKNAEVDEGANLYAYAASNPVNTVDRLGLCCEKEKKLIEDLNALINEVCRYAQIEAERNCFFIHQHPKDPWTFTCQDAQHNAEKVCQDLDQQYADALASATGAYFTCLGFHCHKRCKTTHCQIIQTGFGDGFWQHSPISVCTQE